MTATRAAQHTAKWQPPLRTLRLSRPDPGLLLEPRAGARRRSPGSARLPPSTAHLPLVSAERRTVAALAAPRPALRSDPPNVYRVPAQGDLAHVLHCASPSEASISKSGMRRLPYMLVMPDSLCPAAGRYPRSRPTIDSGSRASKKPSRQKSN